MVCSRARLRITLTARRTGHFMWAGVALTNTADSSIVHTHLGRKTNEREGGIGREKPDRMSRIYKKARLEVRII